MARQSNRQASGKRPRSTASRKRHAAGRSLPGWVWGIAGLSIGLAVAYAVHLHDSGGGPEEVARLLQQPAPSENNATTKPVRSKDEKPQFEFYRLLPEQEVDVQAPTASSSGESNSAANYQAPVKEQEQLATQNESKQLTSTTSKAASAAKSGESYLLQAGSFRGFDDADRMKAKLALLGVEASIQKVELSGGELWHRVRVGPFHARKRVNAVRQRLQKNDVQTILLKRGG